MDVSYKNGVLGISRKNVPAQKKKEMNKPVIVEFNGLPGLGKTTVADILAREIAKCGGIVLRDYRYSKLHTLRSPFPEFFDLKLYRLVSEYAKSIPPIGRKRTHVNWANYYVQKYISIKRHSGADYVIIDEAIIQFLVAIAFQDKMPVSDKVDAIVDRIKSIGVEFVRVDCNNDVETAASRIFSRPSRALLFESMTQEELVRTLEAEAYNFDYLRSVFSRIYENQPVIVIDTKNRPEDNALKIMDSLSLL